MVLSHLNWYVSFLTWPSAGCWHLGSFPGHLHKGPPFLGCSCYFWVSFSQRNSVLYSDIWSPVESWGLLDLSSKNWGSCWVLQDSGLGHKSWSFRNKTLVCVCVCVAWAGSAKLGNTLPKDIQSVILDSKVELHLISGRANLIGDWIP